MGGDVQEFTDAEAFLKCLREELPFSSTTGFRYKVLANDPAIRKAVDDIAYDFWGESALSGKKLALFGSYGWGDGEWMRTWEDTCRSDGAVLACESVICCEAPEDDALAQCKKLGATLAG